MELSCALGRKVNSVGFRTYHQESLHLLLNRYIQCPVLDLRNSISTCAMTVPEGCARSSMLLQTRETISYLTFCPCSRVYPQTCSIMQLSSLHASSAVNANDFSINPFTILRGEEADNASNVDGLANTHVW